MPVPNLRRAVRAVLLDPADRSLLVRWHFEDPDGPFDVWGTPGGGIDGGELPEQAIRRELLEETGLEVADCGSWIAHRVHVAPMRSTDGAIWDGQEEWFYLFRTAPFEPRGRLSDHELRAESLHELRWCSADEIETLAAKPRTVTVPGDLAGLVRRLVADAHPDTTYELGV